MGICQSTGRKKIEIIKVNKTTKNNIIANNNDINKKNNNLLITHINEVQYPNLPTKAVDESQKYKILAFPQEKQVKTPSTISSNSTASCVYTPHSSITFIIEATIGETEIPIFVEKNENIIIKINENNNNINNTWSFLQNEKPVNFLGYPDYKYNNVNIGALFFRITGSQKSYHLNNKINTFNSNSKGSLLFLANLNPNDYSIYEPKGSLQITIIGGNYIYEKELNSPYDINNKYNNLINDYHIKEKKIFKYINKVRNNISDFLNKYFLINDKDEVNQELKDYVNKNYFQRRELEFNKELNNIATKHCEYLGKNGTTGEIDEHNKKILDIVKNKIIFYSSVNIIYGINNPLLIVKRMIRDKYSKSKKNRNNILFHQYNKIGICLREHIAYKYCCVIIFSE